MAVERIPDMGAYTEVFFVDGNSKQGTIAEIEAVIHEYAGMRDIKLSHQLPAESTDGVGHGKMLKLGKVNVERIYGDIKIARFKHGILLIKMSFIAFVKLKLR
ncbi:MAG: hypothetical protein ACI9GW_000672 [Halieaceae bacterium]|jgi:hypothetical protein